MPEPTSLISVLYGTSSNFCTVRFHTENNSNNTITDSVRAVPIP